MEQRRIFLVILMAVLGAVLWHKWTSEHPPQAAQQIAAPATTTTTNNTVTPNVPLSTTTPAAAANTVGTATLVNAPAELIHVKTDVLDVEINPQGGVITNAALLHYPQTQDSPEPVVLLNNEPFTRYLAQSSLVSVDNTFSDNQVTYTSPESHYQTDGEKELVVNMTWQNAKGLQLVKSFTFTPGKYNIGVSYRIQNNGSMVWQGGLYGLLSRTKIEETTSLFNITAFTGASISTTNKPYQKISFKDMLKQPVNQTSIGGWAAMQQHYFLTAWVPDQQQNNRFFTQVEPNNLFTVGVAGPALLVTPGQTVTTSMQLYVGPELGDQLNALAPHLKLTIDYGWLWFISEGIFWLMQKIYDLIGNWGWSIVVVTILIKVAFFHLSATSYRSMAKMRKLQPKMLALKERFGDDRQKMAQATMELYKHEKVNPMSGCLPMLVQIPFFIALYWVLVESVQLRQAPFIFWIHDLSVKDPYFILPLINGFLMFVQQKLNPPPPDPTQAKVMMFMPVVFTVLFLSFPAGLVLYWVVNSMVSILQQWFITRQIEGKDSKVIAKTSS